MDTKVGLKKYEIPKDLHYNLNKGKGRVTGSWLDLIQEPLSQSSNYKKKFSALLHLEEIQAELDIKRYAMEDVTLTPAHPFLVLRVSVSLQRTIHYSGWCSASKPIPKCL